MRFIQRTGDRASITCRGNARVSQSGAAVTEAAIAEAFGQTRLSQPRVARSREVFLAIVSARQVAAQQGAALSAGGGGDAAPGFGARGV
jgi:hypothetical protein